MASMTAQSHPLYRSKWHWVFPLSLCAFWSFFCIPAVFYNLDDSRMIAYFNGDEKWMLDLVWYYFSGQFNPETMQAFYGYGLLSKYIAWFAQVAIAPFYNVTPGLLVGISRSVYLFSGLLAILAIWRLCITHFGQGWTPIISVLSLACCSTFVLHLDFCKPDPVIVFLSIAALDRILAYIDDGSALNIAVASACAATGFVVKIYGILLLPAIVAAIVTRWWVRDDRYAEVAWSANFRWSLRMTPWLIMAFAVGVLWSVVWVVFMKVRKSTNLTLFQEHGFPQVLWVDTYIVEPVFPIIGSLLLLSLCVYLLVYLRKLSDKFSIGQADWAIFLSQLYYASVLAISLFVGFFIVVGFPWLLNPVDLLEKIATFFAIFFLANKNISTFSIASLISEITNNIATYLDTLSGLKSMRGSTYTEGGIIYTLKFYTDMLTPIGVILLFWAFAADVKRLRFKMAERSIHFIKRFHLWIFIVVYTLFTVLFFGRGAQAPHHLIALVPIGFLLIVDRLRGTVINSANRRLHSLAWGLVFASMLLMNGQTAVRLRLDKIQQSKGSEHEVWKVQEWWRENVSSDTPIVADLPYYAYVPPEFLQISYFDSRLHDGVDFTNVQNSLRDKFNKRRPALLYYNAAFHSAHGMPPIEELLPEYNLRLLQTSHEVVNVDPRFRVYEVLWD